MKLSNKRLAQIINDISEGIDNGESREVLRASIKRLATERMNLRQKLVQISGASVVDAYTRNNEMIKWLETH